MFIVLFLDEKIKKFTPRIIDKVAIRKALNFRIKSWDRLLNEENWPTAEVQVPPGELSIPHEGSQEADVPIGVSLLVDVPVRVPLPPQFSASTSLPTKIDNPAGKSSPEEILPKLIPLLFFSPLFF